ncbi:hypothetical protein ACIQCD_22145 [Streptomyces sp. NPDC093250]|uniref:hypothetical protein n=1 Tax=unclassified Streptomyces TaxID=2593676 RepID=UPI00343E1002
MTRNTTTINVNEVTLSVESFGDDDAPLVLLAGGTTMLAHAKRTVRVPLGEAPTVAVVLGEKGGQAGCTLAIRGKHVQRATASGAYGRATCAGELPVGER